MDFLFFYVWLGFAMLFFGWLTIMGVLHNKKPVTEQRVTVLAKRQELMGAMMTMHYVTFEGEGGSRTEVVVEGKDYGLLVEGDKGTLSMKGHAFQGFQRQRLIAR